MVCKMKCQNSKEKRHLETSVELIVIHHNNYVQTQEEYADFVLQLDHFNMKY